MGLLVLTVASLVVASVAASCAYPPREALSNSWVGLSVERRSKLSPIVFHGLAVETYPTLTPDAPSKGFHYNAQFWLISVYKSARELAAFFGTGPPVNGVYDIRDRRVNVTGFYRPNATATPHCWVPVTSQKYYVIFAEIINGELTAKEDGTRGATADWTEQNEARVWKGVVSAILPTYDDSPSVEIENNKPLDFDLFKPHNEDKSNVKRNPSEPCEDPFSSIEGLRRELAKISSSVRERPGAMPAARTIKELEDLIAHPTWLTDSSKKKFNRQLGENKQLGDGRQMAEKSRRIFAAPVALSASDGQWYPKVIEDQREHIKEVITKFQTYKSKPITDNRITKFVFTNDGDLAMSKTVREHNREVEAAFMDFNKKLEETLSSKEARKEEGKKVVIVNMNNKQTNRPETSKNDAQDISFNKVVNFLNRNIHKLKDETPHHKQVCSKHQSHSKDDDYNFEEPSQVKFAGSRRFNQLAQTRDGLESILLGLDRPWRGPFKRQIAPKPNKVSVEFSDKK